MINFDDFGMVFGCHLDAIWMPFGYHLDAFSMLFGTRDVPGVHFCEFVNFCDFGDVSAAKGESLFESILVLLATF